MPPQFEYDPGLASDGHCSYLAIKRLTGVAPEVNLGIARKRTSAKSTQGLKHRTEVQTALSVAIQKDI